jgi:formate-dependent phosphoribosylglycinamide formyltransferase (GAR transformylase)
MRLKHRCRRRTGSGTFAALVGAVNVDEDNNEGWKPASNSESFNANQNRVVQLQQPPNHLR